MSISPYPVVLTDQMPYYTTRLERHPFDPSGRNDQNLIEDIFRLDNKQANEYKVYVPKGAPFFVDSVEIYRLNTDMTVDMDTKLVPKLDYTFGGMFWGAKNFTVSDIDIATVIIFDDHEIDGDWVIRYRTLGGPYLMDIDRYNEDIGNYLDNPIYAQWDQVVGKPIQVIPEPHVHHACELTNVRDALSPLSEMAEGYRQLAEAERSNEGILREYYEATERAKTSDDTILDRVRNEIMPSYENKIQQVKQIAERNKSEKVDRTNFETKIDEIQRTHEPLVRDVELLKQTTAEVRGKFSELRQKVDNDFIHKDTRSAGEESGKTVTIEKTSDKAYVNSGIVFNNVRGASNLYPMNVMVMQTAQASYTSTLNQLREGIPGGLALTYPFVHVQDLFLNNGSYPGLIGTSLVSLLKLQNAKMNDLANQISAVQGNVDGIGGFVREDNLRYIESNDGQTIPDHAAPLLKPDGSIAVKSVKTRQLNIGNGQILEGTNNTLAFNQDIRVPDVFLGLGNQAYPISTLLDKLKHTPFYEVTSTLGTMTPNQQLLINDNGRTILPYAIQIGASNGMKTTATLSQYRLRGNFIHYVIQNDRIVNNILHPDQGPSCKLEFDGGLSIAAKDFIVNGNSLNETIHLLNRDKLDTLDIIPDYRFVYPEKLLKVSNEGHVNLYKLKINRQGSSIWHNLEPASFMDGANPIEALRNNLPIQSTNFYINNRSITSLLAEKIDKTDRQSMGTFPRNKVVMSSSNGDIDIGTLNFYSEQNQNMGKLHLFTVPQLSNEVVINTNKKLRAGDFIFHDVSFFPGVSNGSLMAMLRSLFPQSNNNDRTDGRLLKMFDGGKIYVNKAKIGNTDIERDGDYLKFSTKGKFTDIQITSDRRTKEEVKPLLESNLKKVEQMDVVTFKRIGSDVEEIGFIAQNLQSIDPRFVSEGTDGILSVNQSALIATLMGAIQELSEQVKELRNA